MVNTYDVWQCFSQCRLVTCVSWVLWDLWSSQRRCWRFKSSGMLRHADVCKYCSGCVFGVKLSCQKSSLTAWPWRWRNYIPSKLPGLRTHPRRQLTPWSRILPEKLTRLQLVKKFHAFYGTRKFITTFTTARHLCLSWATSIQYVPPTSPGVPPPPQPTSRRSNLVLFSHLRLGLPSGLILSGFSTKTLYAPLLFPTRATCSVHLSRYADYTKNK